MPRVPKLSADCLSFDFLKREMLIRGRDKFTQSYTLMAKEVELICKLIMKGDECGLPTLPIPPNEEEDAIDALTTEVRAFIIEAYDNLDEKLDGAILTKALLLYGRCAFVLMNIPFNLTRRLYLWAGNVLEIEFNLPMPYGRDALVKSGGVNQESGRHPEALEGDIAPEDIPPLSDEEREELGATGGEEPEDVLDLDTEEIDESRLASVVVQIENRQGRDAPRRLERQSRSAAQTQSYEPAQTEPYAIVRRCWRCYEPLSETHHFATCQNRRKRSQRDYERRARFLARSQERHRY